MSNLSVTTSEEKNFLEQMKAQIFLEAILAMEIMCQPQSNLEEKVNLSILFFLLNKIYVIYSRFKTIYRSIQP